MIYISVTNRGITRKIGFPMESSYESIQQAIRDTFELPKFVRFSCVSAPSGVVSDREIDMRDVVNGTVKSVGIKIQEIEEEDLNSRPEQTLFDLLNPLYSGTDSISKRGYMPIRDTIEADEETPLSSSFSKSRDKNGRTVEYISIDNSAEEKQESENLAVVPAQSDFQGDRYQGQIMKFERILAHLVNERTVLAWFRTNLAFVILGLKYLKLGNVYLDSEHFASILLFICGGVFLAILPFSWYSGYYRYEKCKEMIDYNIDQLGNFLYKLGFDFDNMSLAFIIFSSFFGIIISSTMIIWTTTTSDDYSPI
jgi:hypothetical protein